MQTSRRCREFTIGLLSLGLLAGVALMVDQAQAATSNGPYYAEPAWDQKLDAATRFVVLSNWNSEAVLDRETGLVWEKTPDATLREWLGALGNCVEKKVGGRLGWRLPSFSELASLIEPSVVYPDPKLPTGHPFSNVKGIIDADAHTTASYWSATASRFLGIDVSTGLAKGAYVADFFDGKMGIRPVNDLNLFWCVRGGGPLSEY